MSVEVSLTVGKLDASLALLTTSNHHVIEFPTILLPDNIKAGSIVKLNLTEDFEQEIKEREKFIRIQDKILEKYGTLEPQKPNLRVINVTQTSCVLEWDTLDIGSSQLISLILYKQDVRVLNIPNALCSTSTKVSGLSIDTDYEFQLKMSTTSGKLWSNKLKVHTHKMTDMSGITVCLGSIDSTSGITEAQIKNSLKKIGAKPLQKVVTLDTTHFICSDLNNEDLELARAKRSNIPVVRPEWIRACELEERIVGVRGFYLEVDPNTLESYKFSTCISEQDASKPSNTKDADEEPHHKQSDSEVSNKQVSADEKKHETKYDNKDIENGLNIDVKLDEIPNEPEKTDNADNEEILTNEIPVSEHNSIVTEVAEVADTLSTSTNPEVSESEKTPAKDNDVSLNSMDQNLVVNKDTEDLNSINEETLKKVEDKVIISSETSETNPYNISEGPKISNEAPDDLIEKNTQYSITEDPEGTVLSANNEI